MYCTCHLSQLTTMEADTQVDVACLWIGQVDQGSAGSSHGCHGELGNADGVVLLVLDQVAGAEVRVAYTSGCANVREGGLHDKLAFLLIPMVSTLKRSNSSTKASKLVSIEQARV